MQNAARGFVAEHKFEELGEVELPIGNRLETGLRCRHKDSSEICRQREDRQELNGDWSGKQPRYDRDRVQEPASIFPGFLATPLDSTARTSFPYRTPGNSCDGRKLRPTASNVIRPDATKGGCLRRQPNRTHNEQSSCGEGAVRARVDPTVSDAAGSFR